ncbi:MAG: tetratricopeptide repeat protein [Bacteroidetes bacterium]|nr:tetratricopeptide repeat protein [Bacteroidota bacterium]
MNKIVKLLLVFLITGSSLFAQKQRKIDSLKTMLSGSIHDTIRTKTLNALAKLYWTNNPDTAMVLVLQSEKVAEKLKDKKYQCITTIYKAYIISALGNYDSAIVVYQQAIDLSKKNKKDKPLGQALTALGNVYNIIGDYDSAIKYYMEALTIQERLADKVGMAKTYNSLGVLFEWQKDYKSALNYHKQAFVIKTELEDSVEMATSLNNMGIVYESMKDTENALKHHLQSLEIRKLIDDKNGLIMSYTNLGNIYSHNNKSKEAIDFLSKAYALAIEIKDRLNLARVAFDLGNHYFIIKEYEKGVKYILEAEGISEEMEIKELQRDVYKELSDYFIMKKDYKAALDYSLKYRDVNDSLYNENKTKEIQGLNSKYQSEKKEQEINSLNQQSKIQQLDIKQKRTSMYSLFAGVLLLILIAIILFNRNRIKQKANKELAEKNNLIEHQKHLVEEKNHEITDSINYAKRIQTALLPSEDSFKELIPQSFVLFKPKDIVSGDFFWINGKDNFIFYVAADCTGHGVPGAFMSMLGTSFLNEIINEKDVIEPGDILDLLKIKIIKSLKQKGEVGSNKDGMDMVLCRIDTSKNELVFAAANNPLWLLRDGEIIEYKADKQPVGIGSEGFEHFNQHTIQLLKGDLVYTFSDGYADQFGGPKGKKFKYKQMEEIILANANESMEFQKNGLDERFEKWRGELEQVDDVCIIGVKI